MRRALVVANWKLNKTVAEALAFAAELRALALAEGPEVVVAPPATALHPLAAPLAELGVALCAQGAFAEDRGAYTGALSAPVLAEAGARYLLVGHNERRTLFGETPEVTGALLLAAQRAKLGAILCVGENEAARSAGRHLAEVRGQLDAALAPLASPPEAPHALVVAYEPVWAIGAGRGAQVPEVEEVHEALRTALAERWGQKAAEGVRLLYGGSVQPRNVAGFAKSPWVDGVLVGGASLRATDFAALVREVARVG